MMPASVRADADAVVGVFVPDDSGVIGAGAIVVERSHRLREMSSMIAYQARYVD